MVLPGVTTSLSVSRLTLKTASWRTIPRAWDRARGPRRRGLSSSTGCARGMRMRLRPDPTVHEYNWPPWRTPRRTSENFRCCVDLSGVSLEMQSFDLSFAALAACFICSSLALAAQTWGLGSPEAEAAERRAALPQHYSRLPSLAGLHKLAGKLAGISLVRLKRYKYVPEPPNSAPHKRALVNGDVFEHHERDRREYAKTCGG